MQHTVGTIASGRTRLSGFAREPRCRLCRASITPATIDLGVPPPAADQLDVAEARDQLQILVCEKCFLVQLGPFDGWSTISACPAAGLPARIAAARADIQRIQRQLKLGPQDLVVEIGSSEGYLLQHCPPLSVPVLGIDPADHVANAAHRRGVTTLGERFTPALAERLVSEGKWASLVVASNVLGEVPAPNDFMDAVKLLLAPEGVVIIEVPHLTRLVAGMQVEAFCRRRFSYFSLLTLDHLAESHGLKVIDAEKLDTAGGSLRIYLAHAASFRQPAARVSELLEEEVDEGFLTLEPYTRFAEQARDARQERTSAAA